MTVVSKHSGPLTLAILLGLGGSACNTRAQLGDDAAPAPIDIGMQTGNVDTAATSTITPPSPVSRDTPPPAAQPAKPAGQEGKGAGLKVSVVEYEGWRQYSVNCARCHGQDVLPNPVAANLLLSLGPKGPVKSTEEFAEIVSAGRLASGMPAFKGILTPEQIKAIYEYVKGRAEGRIPPGRPDRPA